MIPLVNIFWGKVAFGFYWCYRFSRSHSHIPLQWTKLPLNISSFYCVVWHFGFVPIRYCYLVTILSQSSICDWKCCKNSSYLKIWRLHLYIFLKLQKSSALYRVFSFNFIILLPIFWSLVVNTLNRLPITSLKYNLM